MRRQLWMLVAAGMACSLLMASEANACHFKLCCHKEPACEPCPPPPPPPPCEPKPCCFGGLFKKHSLFCHAPKCAPAPCAAPAPCPAPAVWAPSPQWAAPSAQWVAPTMQTPAAPSKQGW
jgi:hypothetical protein